MSDDLTVSVSGSSSVVTADLVDRARDLDALRDEIRLSTARVTGTALFVCAPILHAAAAPPSAFAAESDIDLAISLLGAAAHNSELIASGLRAAAIAYSVAEAAKERALEHLAAQIGYGAGLMFPALLVGIGGPTLVTAVTVSVASGGPEAAAGNLRDWLTANNQLITDPTFVALVHLASKSIDDLLAGFAGVPQIGETIQGDQGLDVVGDDAAAAVIVLGGSTIGLFGEGKVSVAPTGTTSDSAGPPSGLKDRISRIPKTGENGGSQIVIEKYTHPDGHVSWEVYFSGTQDFSPSGTSTPFDMTSNMNMMGHLPAGSLDAAKDAMRQAGVGKNDPIVFTGHSQGGLLAHELASSGDYNVTGVVEIGGPVSGSTLPDGANGVAIVHTDDLVPALGVDRPVDHNEVVVERQAFADIPIPKDEAVPAHNRDRYLETAAMADQSAREELVHARNAMDAASADAISMTSTTYKAVRETGEGASD